MTATVWAQWETDTIVMGGIIRLLLATFTFGTNDVQLWIGFYETIKVAGPLGIYGQVPLFNHPPMISICLWLTQWILPWFHGNFPLLLRLPSALADLGTAILVYLLVSRFYDEGRARLSACLVALSPVSILISGFHGNTDPVFIFMLFLSAYCLLIKNHIFLSSVLLGLSASIKIVPLLTIPLFVLWLPTWKKRALFLSGLLSLLLLTYGYPLFRMPQPILKNVFAYGGNTGLWGLGLLLQPLWPNAVLLAPVQKLLIILTSLSIAFRASKQLRQLDASGASRLFSKVSAGLLSHSLFFPRALEYSIYPGLCPPS